MAPRSIGVPVSLELVSEDPDGSACVNCGDMIYLDQWQFVLRIGKPGSLPPHKFGDAIDTEYKYCWSCADEIAEIMEGGR